MRTASLLLLGLVLLVLGTAIGYLAYRLLPDHKRWVVYYGNTLPFSAFQPYDIVVLDSDAYPAFTDGRRPGQVVLGYLSTAEAEEYRPYFRQIEALGVLMEPAGGPPLRIDIRNPAWREFFVDTLVPHVLAKGFDGIMLDTIDTPLYLEESRPAEARGMHEAAVALIRAVRAAHPDIRIMLNRGFQILPEVAGEIDYFLAESIRVDYRMDDHSHRYFPQEVYASYLDIIGEAKAINPGLTVVSLDYWDMSGAGRNDVRRLYAEQRRHGLIPYVTTVDLAHHHEEPQ